MHSQYSAIVPIRGYFKWLTKSNHIHSNPASELELPRLNRKLPHHVLTINEVEQVLLLPDISTETGLRDRTMMEVFYSTGMRRQELVNLSVYDIDRERRIVLIRQGKGQKDRYVPLGERALTWVEKYQHQGAA